MFDVCIYKLLIFTLSNNNKTNTMKKLSTYNLPSLIIFLLAFVMLSICLFNLLTSNINSPNVNMFMNNIAFSGIAIMITINSLKK